MYVYTYMYIENVFTQSYNQRCHRLKKTRGIWGLIWGPLTLSNPLYITEHSIIVIGLRGALNCSPIMPRDASLSVQWMCDFFQSVFTIIYIYICMYIGKYEVNYTYIYIFVSYHSQGPLHDGFFSVLLSKKITLTIFRAQIYYIIKYFLRFTMRKSWVLLDWLFLFQYNESCLESNIGILLGILESNLGIILGILKSNLWIFEFCLESWNRILESCWITPVI